MVASWASDVTLILMQKRLLQRFFVFSDLINPISNHYYPIYTCTLAMVEPWPSEVLFTLGELYPRQTGQPRLDYLGEGQV